VAQEFWTLQKYRRYNTVPIIVRSTKVLLQRKIIDNSGMPIIIFEFQKQRPVKAALSWVKIIRYKKSHSQINRISSSI
jgi:hypothetical protein